MHILSGGFLTMLSLLYFLAASGPHVLSLSSKVSFCVKALVIMTFFMVGHRSGFVGLLLGIVTLAFFNKRQAVKEAAAFILIAVMGAGVAIILSPDIVLKLSERASTTFDTGEQTYQERYHQIFLITRITPHIIIKKSFYTWFFPNQFHYLSYTSKVEKLNICMLLLNCLNKGITS